MLFGKGGYNEDCSRGCEFVGIIEVRPLLLQFEIDAAYERVINTNGSAIIYAGTLIRRNARADKPAVQRANQYFIRNLSLARSFSLHSLPVCVCKYAHVRANLTTRPTAEWAQYAITIQAGISCNKSIRKARDFFDG